MAFLLCGSSSRDVSNGQLKRWRTRTTCEFSSITTLQLKDHMMRTHTGEKPFKCNQCNYACAQSGDLQKHMRTHSGEKPFQCNQCSKAFTQKRNLAKHLKIHNREMSNKCDQCDYASSQADLLTEHSKTHTEGKSNEENQDEFSSIIQSWTNALETHMMKI